MIEEARKELRAVAGALTSVRYRLLGVQASIPPSPLETSRGDLEGDPDVATEMRSVIGGGIQDCLDPLIEDLFAAAEYEPVRGVEGNAEAGRMQSEAPSIAHLDLSVDSEETRRALYELVVADYFRPAKPEPPDEEVWVPPYTPEQAGLEVVYAWGYWFATWWKLELPAELSEAERRETLFLEEDPERPGTLMYRDV